jgi:hypothetical protein
MVSQNRPKKRPFSESVEPSEFEFARIERRFFSPVVSKGSRIRIESLLSEKETRAFVSELTVGFAHRFVAGFEVVVAALRQSPSQEMKHAALKLVREIQVETDSRSQAVIARIIEAIESGEPDQLRAAECAITRSAELIFEYPLSYTAAGKWFQRRLQQQARTQTRSKATRGK